MDLLGDLKVLRYLNLDDVMPFLNLLHLLAKIVIIIKNNYYFST